MTNDEKATREIIKLINKDIANVAKNYRDKQARLNKEIKKLSKIKNVY